MSEFSTSLLLDTYSTRCPAACSLIATATFPLCAQAVHVAARFYTSERASNEARTKEGRTGAWTSKQQAAVERRVGMRYECVNASLLTATRIVDGTFGPSSYAARPTTLLQSALASYFSFFLFFMFSFLSFCKSPLPSVGRVLI